MVKLTTQMRVYNYFDNQEKWGLPKLIYRKGKWFSMINKRNYYTYIYDIRKFLYYLDRHNRNKNFYNRVFNFQEPSEVDNFVKMYADVFGEDGDWFEQKYAVLGKEKYEECVKIKGERLPDLPFPLDVKQLLIIGVLLFKPEEEVFFITTGIGGSGKSTFLNIVRQLYPNDFYSSTLTNLTDIHTMSSAVLKSLICGDEIGTKELNLDNLKTLASKQYVDCNPKFERPFTMKSQSSIFYCCNKTPRFDITDSGVMRRIVFYFRNTPIDNPDLSLKDKTFSEEELTTISAHAYFAITHIENWKEQFLHETWDLIKKTSSVYRFYGKVKFYSEYQERCKEDGLRPCSAPNWEDICEIIKEYEEKTKDDEELPF